MLWLGILFSVLTAIATNLAFLWKHRGAVAAAPVDVRRPGRSAAELFRSRWWAIGWTVAVTGWVFHVGALTFAEGLAVIAATSEAANISALAGGIVVVGEQLGDSPGAIALRSTAFALVILGAALVPGLMRAAEAAAEQERDEHARHRQHRFDRAGDPSAA